MAEAEGAPFGRYRLAELLGRGGMGEVWRARDTEIDRIVAIKMLLPHFAQDDKFVQRFRREARLAARLENPHVVPIYDIGQVDGRLYVVMRLIPGQDLQTLLDEGPLEPQRAVGIIAQIAKALHAAHKVGLVHRDIKPSNILLDDDDFAYLIDFGIARAAGETGLTSTGATIGTWSYMSPERFSTGVAEPSSDIYALACVLFQCLTGQLPFPAVALEQIAVAHMTAPPPRPSTQLGAIPEAMDEVIATGLAKDPAQRYATTTELATAAREAITAPIPRPSPAPPAPPSEPNFHAAPPVTVVAPTARAPRSPAARAPRPGGPAQRPNVPSPAAQSPPADEATPTSPVRRRTRALILTAVGVTVAVTIAVITLVASNQHPSPSGGTNPQPPVYGSQTVLPFTGFIGIWGVAVDSAGAVYAADFSANSRVVKLAAGSTTQTVLPFTGLNSPFGVAVDSAGAVYAADSNNNRVVELAAGSPTQTVLPFAGLNDPKGVAVDGAGAVYVADTGNQRVVKLAAGSTTQTVLPFNDLTGLNGIAVDNAGTVYVADGSNQQVVKLAAGSNAPTVLPFTGLWNPEGVAVDSAGAVYVADWGNKRVLKLAAGSNAPTELPFTGLGIPEGVALDNSGAVYVADNSFNRVVKLAR